MQRFALEEVSVYHSRMNKSNGTLPGVQCFGSGNLSTLIFRREYLWFLGWKKSLRIITNTQIWRCYWTDMKYFIYCGVFFCTFLWELALCMHRPQEARCSAWGCVEVNPPVPFISPTNCTSESCTSKSYWHFNLYYHLDFCLAFRLLVVLGFF